MTQKELNLDQFLPLSTDVLSDARLIGDPDNQDVYLIIQITSSYFDTDTSYDPGMVVRFDSNLNLIWWKKFVGVPSA